MRLLVDKWNISVLALFFVMKALQMFGRIGIRRQNDSWRRSMAPFFKAEHAKFTIAAFKLDFCSDLPPGTIVNLETAKKHVIDRLANFLRRHPEAHWKLAWSLTGVKRSRIKRADIIHVVFGQQGRLDNLEVYFDSAEDDGLETSPAMQEQIVRWIKEAYNDTVRIYDESRPAILAKKIRKRLRVQLRGSKKERIDAELFTERVLTGTYIHFSESLRYGESTNLERFDIPDLNGGMHPGFGLFNVHCRFSDYHREADLWFEASHILVDGAIIQDLVENLKKSWGIRGVVKAPSPSEADSLVIQRCSPVWAKKPVFQGKLLVDFQSLLAVKKDLSHRYMLEVGGSITLASMLAWGLAHTECFEGIKFLIPVDVHSPKSLERTLCHVIIRPQTYFTRKNPLCGFIEYQREFNRRLFAAREGRGEVQEMLDAFALNPQFVNEVVYKLMPSAVHELFGHAVITILKESDFFVCPLDDIHTKGTIAFGSMNLPTEDGGKAGWVTVRANQDQVDRYLYYVRNVVQHFSKYL